MIAARRAHRRVMVPTVAAIILFAARVHAQQSPILARGQIIISGIGLQASPAHQTVPRNIATAVDVTLVATWWDPPHAASSSAAAGIESKRLSFMRCSCRDR